MWFSDLAQRAFDICRILLRHVRRHSSSCALTHGSCDYVRSNVVNSDDGRQWMRLHKGQKSPIIAFRIRLLVLLFTICIEEFSSHVTDGSTDRTHQCIARPRVGGPRNNDRQMYQFTDCRR